MRINGGWINNDLQLPKPSILLYSVLVFFTVPNESVPNLERGKPAVRKAQFRGVDLHTVIICCLVTLLREADLDKQESTVPVILAIGLYEADISSLVPLYFLV